MREQLQIDGIDVFIEGPVEGPGPGKDVKTIVMIHGWPDTYRLWDAQVAAFQSQYRCVRFTLPGFDIDKPRRAYSLDELMQLFANIVRTTTPNQKVILLVHDWGAAFGYQFYMRYPELMSHLIGVDIGDASSAEFEKHLTWKAKLLIEGYQGWLSLSWRVGGSVGDSMAVGMAKAMKCKSDPRYISAKMSYPYFIKRTGAYGSYDDLRPLLTTCPMMFIYGTQKPFMFHSHQWLDELAQRPGCKVLAMATDHWPMRAAPDAFNQAVLGWLAAPVHPPN